MNNSPKLKQALEEIKKILKHYDLGATVVLHTPGHSEYLVRIDPTYSCARFEGDTNIRIRARLDKDFNGDKNALMKTMTDTANMMRLLSELNCLITLNLMDVSKMVDKATDAHHYRGGTPNQSKNN